MSADDREAVEVAVAERIVEAVDEVHAAGRARVGLVGHVGVGEVAARAVVGAPACAEAVLGVAGRREDHVVRVGVDAAEMGCQRGGFVGDLGLGRGGRNGAVVGPGAGELVVRVRRVDSRRPALRCAVGDPLAVLGRRVGPRAATDAAEEVLNVGLGLGAGVAPGAEPARPLLAPVDDVDLRAWLDRAAVVEEVARVVRPLGVRQLDLHEGGSGLVSAGCRAGGEEQNNGGEQRKKQLGRPAHVGFLPLRG